MAKEKDVTDLLLEEGDKKEKAQPLKEIVIKAPKEEKKEKEKPENKAFETPQDRFRRIIKDMGYSTGVENMTSVFFEGDTDSPSWLDDVLKLSHIPAKNRELIITAYYGKPLKDLGISVDPIISQSKSDKLKEKESEKAKVSDELLDLAKISEDELKERVKAEKTLLSLAQLRAMREEIESRGKKETPSQQQAVQMRQVSRPVVGSDGKIVTGKDGTIVYETVVEPVSNSQNQLGHGGDFLSMVAAMKALMGGEEKKGQPSEIAEAIRMMQQQMNEMKLENERRAKEDEIKRLSEKLEKQTEEHRRELERRENDFKDKLDELNKERLRDLEALEKRFQETIEHKREMDAIIGAVSSEHKKEMDSLKQRLEHAQTSIERTVVAKGTDTVDKLSGKMADVVESVVKPMAGVMKDHYSTIIETERQKLGLPSLKESIPKVTESELEQFAKGG